MVCDHYILLLNLIYLYCMSYLQHIRKNPSWGFSLLLYLPLQQELLPLHDEPHGRQDGTIIWLGISPCGRNTTINYMCNVFSICMLNGVPLQHLKHVLHLLYLTLRWFRLQCFVWGQSQSSVNRKQRIGYWYSNSITLWYRMP